MKALAREHEGSASTRSSSLAQADGGKASLVRCRGRGGGSRAKMQSCPASPRAPGTLGECSPSWARSSCAPVQCTEHSCSCSCLTPSTVGRPNLALPRLTVREGMLLFTREFQLYTRIGAVITAEHVETRANAIRDLQVAPEGTPLPVTPRTTREEIRGKPPTTRAS